MRPNNLRYSGLRSFLFALLVCLTAIAPSGQYGYAVPAISALMAIAVCMTMFHVQASAVPVALLTGAVLPSLLFTFLYVMDTAAGVWEFRDYIRFTFLFVFVISLPREVVRKTAVYLAYLTVTVLLVDLVALHFQLFPGVRTIWYALAVNPQLMDYLDGYYRHVGIIGSPNLSGGFYAVSLYFLCFFPGLSKGVRIIGIPVAALLLLESQSRSHMIAFALAAIVPLLRMDFSYVIKYAFVFVSASLATLVLMADYETFAGILLGRIENISAFSERLEIGSALLDRIGPLELFAGNPDTPSVVDNDLLFFLFRFGLLVTMYVSFMIAAVSWKAFHRKSPELLGLVLLCVVSSIAGGVLGHPGLAFFAATVLRLFIEVTKPDKMPSSSNQLVIDSCTGKGTPAWPNSPLTLPSLQTRERIKGGGTDAMALFHYLCKPQ